MSVFSVLCFGAMSPGVDVILSYGRRKSTMQCGFYEQRIEAEGNNRSLWTDKDVLECPVLCQYSSKLIVMSYFSLRNSYN